MLCKFSNTTQQYIISLRFDLQFWFSMSLEEIPFGWKQNKSSIYIKDYSSRSHPPKRENVLPGQGISVWSWLID